MGNLIALVFACGLLNCQPNATPNEDIRGIYGSPISFWDQGINLKDLGVNAAFIHSGTINKDIMSRARSEGLKVFAEFATLNGKGYVEQYPAAWAINSKGEKVAPATWFMGVCPTEPGFREYRSNKLRNLLSEFDLDGVWLDYVHWHAQFEDPEPILPETCFCDNCLKQFTNYSNIQLPPGTTQLKAHWILNNHDSTWREWRCKVIFDWAFELKAILKEKNPEALLGLYHCPWKDHEYDKASRRILGLDYDLLVGVIDVFSPMVYHGRMERSPEWVGENTRWFSDRLNIQKNKGPKIWPIVQAFNDPKVIPGEDFETVLRGGLSGKASGVMMFTSNAVAEDQQKTAIMQKIYTSIRDQK